MEEEIKKYRDLIREDLDRVVDFWMTYSIDKENGGFFTCLTADGQVYETSKYGWLQGRQIWMLTKLYQVERFKKADIFEAALAGADFIMSKMKDEKSGKIYFSTTASGEPTKMQRTLYAEVFYVMAMAGMYRITQDVKYKVSICVVRKT